MKAAAWEPLDLVGRMRGEISAAGGAIPFARYMALALYKPGLGYYERSERVVGRGGDFITSVSVGPLFGELLARWILDVVPGVHGLADGPVEIIEAGAHDGRLAEDILGAIERLGGADAARFGYRILEPSPVRQSWQAARLARFGDRVRWSPSMPGRDTGVPGLRGVILSNELLDAFPVERWRWSADRGRWVEQGVAWRQDRFEWVPLPTPPPPGWELPRELEAVLPEGFVRERSPAAVDWWANAARSLEAGCLLAIDYGLDAEEFLVPHRAEGTLRAYHRHRVGGDLLASPGEVDLTAHVDFSAIAGAGEREGLTTWCRQSQSRFLLGILESTRRSPSGFPEWTQARVRAFQTLTHPEHFGRSFRVLAQGRGPAPAGAR